MINKGVFECIETIPKGAAVEESYVHQNEIQCTLVAGGNDMDRTIYGKMREAHQLYI